MVETLIVARTTLTKIGFVKAKSLHKPFFLFIKVAAKRDLLLFATLR